MEDIRNEVTGSYDASQIQVLEGLEAVRRRQIGRASCRDRV